jgi:predicted tellurium resistance membrane protein TerC
MSKTSLHRFGLTLLVLMSFALGASLKFFPSMSGVVSSILSSIAWALSATSEEFESSAGPNLMAALFAALATGFFYQASS